MNLSAPFIARPVATVLLAIGILLAGLFAYGKLPVAPLPQVDFPTILVQAQQPGASPETMGTSVAAPLERHLGSIADVTEMTSQSTVGLTRITLQFGLDRDINGAARDVQAGIQAARADLPTSLRTNPSYKKFNPADSPIMILALTSKTRSAGQIYDEASNVLEQALSQLSGVGNVDIAGSTLPAVRVELDPYPLFKYGIGLEDVRAALASANANAPKGAIEEGNRRFQIYTNDQATKAEDYRNLVIAYRNGAAVRLRDVAEVDDSVENLRTAGRFNGVPAVLAIIYRQPGANVITTVDTIMAELPRLEASLPGDVQVSVAMDRTKTIRGSLNDTQLTLVIAVILVTLVVFAFLRDPRATLIPAIAVPISIIGTFGAMYLLGYSLDNLSLMALTISTGFVVDDAIVVLENIQRHVEAGMPRVDAALLGAREIGFTVLTISVSLVAVFTPILLLGGIVGRLFHEFALTLSLAIMISMVISLTLTPMMCSRLLRPEKGRSHGRLYRFSEHVFDWMARFYERTLTVALRWKGLTVLTLLVTMTLTVVLARALLGALFPDQDTGLMLGTIQADQSISFQLMEKKLVDLMSIVKSDPAVATVAGFTGGRGTNGGFVFVSLKPQGQRNLSVQQVINRLRPKLAAIPGATLYLFAAQDLRTGGRQSNAAYQYTLEADTATELYAWTPKLTEALARNPNLVDVNSDQQQHGLAVDLHIDRATAARLGLTPSAIDNTLYDAFGQRQVSTIYNALNQYHVIMEVAPNFWQSPDTLRTIWVSTSGASAKGTATTQAPAGTVAGRTARINTSASPSVTTSTAPSIGSAGPTSSGTSVSATVASPASNSANTSSGNSTAQAIAQDSARNQAINAIAASGKSTASSGNSVSNYQETMVPLASFASFTPGTTPLSVNHEGQFVAATISFNLPPGKALGDAQAAIQQAEQEIHLPASIHGVFAGTAATTQQSMAALPFLLLAALTAVYIVLGVLYESYIHPITIMSTLPSAGVGALAALLIFGQQLSIIAFIGIILLVGIVKKNAIMMIDVALHAERAEHLSTEDAIRKAALLRFRPITMTTAAAMLGALPLAIGTGEGAELRHPLGIAIVGGLIGSQALTLYTTPVVYIYLDHFGKWCARHWARVLPPAPPESVPEPGE